MGLLGLVPLVLILVHELEACIEILDTPAVAALQDRKMIHKRYFELLRESREKV